MREAVVLFFPYGILNRQSNDKNQWQLGIIFTIAEQKGQQSLEIVRKQMQGLKVTSPST